VAPLTLDFLTFDLRLKLLSFSMFKFITKLKRPISTASQCTLPRPRFLPSTFRLSTFRLLLTFHFSLLIFNCGLDIEDPTPPSPPVWVQKSLPEEWPERGIDAHESGAIFLEWEPNPEDHISAYLIYSAHYLEGNDSLGDFELLHRQDARSMINPSFLHSDAKVRVKYFYKLKAEDGSENLSDFSDSTFYTLLPSLPVYRMFPLGNGDTLNNVRQLTWNYDYRIEMENYCLTILTQSNSLILRTVLNPTNYVNRAESWLIPDSVVLNSNQIYKWRIDVGAQYVDNLEISGSESAWATFLFSG
jgi:hypothetical protein